MPVVLDPCETTEQLTGEEMRRLVAAITRRRIVISGTLLTLAASVPAPARGQQTTPGAMRELTDSMGPVQVPEHPQRVIVEGNSTLGNMIALGMKPIAASFNPNSLPTFMADQVEGVVDVLDLGAGAINIEKALSLSPDLIIAYSGSGGEDWNRENVERYKQALPATYAYEQSYVYEEDIKRNLIEVAKALNVEDRAAKVLEAYDRRVAELRQAVIDVGFDDKPVTVVRVFNDGTYSIRIGTSESIIFRAVGIPRPEGQQEPELFSLELSLERLDMLNAAYAVIVYVDDNSQVTQEEILTNTLWQSVTPVREGRVIFVNSGVWNSIEMPGAMAIMDDIEALLLPLAGKT